VLMEKRTGRALAFSCSPRVEKGATDLLLGAFLDGYREAGGEALVLNPYKMNIEPCRGCFRCWTRTPGICVIDDDMKEVLEQMQRADDVVFATPVYHFTMSEGMKRLLERTMPLLEPKVSVGPDGTATHARIGPHGQRAVLLSACGFPEIEVFVPMRATFAAISKMMEWRPAGEVLRTMSGLLLSRDGRAQESTRGYLHMVKMAGAKMAEGKVIDAQYRTYLEQELLPAEEYYRLVNEWF
jgi:multimeric flavodoxin WrbA